MSTSDKDSVINNIYRQSSNTESYLNSYLKKNMI